jgi:outer membrane protein insertion porin family
MRSSKKVMVRFFQRLIVFGAFFLILPLVFAETTSSSETPKSSNENPGVVFEIKFIGNTINKSKSLERKIKTRKNQPVDRKKLQGDIKILFETGDFDDVSVDIIHLDKKDSKGQPLKRIEFTLIERSVIKRIDFKGNRKIKSISFEDKLESKEGNPYDKFKASLDERSILEYYRNEGYAKAQVEHYTTVDSRKKELILTYFILEGDRVLVKSIHVMGVKRFSEKKSNSPN